MLQNGDVIDGMYQVIQEIGKGGTGVVYLGWHLRLCKQIVIKRIKENYNGRINVRKEADILKRLHHTYLPQVYDFLEVGGGIYTVMDYIPGSDLQHYLDSGYTFPQQTLLLWMKQLCEVLDYLHTQDPPILHSDIKPGNIMITPQGNVCLIDFNISLDGSENGKLQGLSPHYAAPEQYQAAMDMLYSGGGNFVPDCRMDIYSLGAVFYRMMTGYLPEPRTGVPYPIMDLDIPYSDGVKAIISKAVALNPTRRFRTVRRMLDALQNLEKMDPRYRWLGKLQCMSGILCGVCVAAGVLLIYSGFGLWQKDIWQERYTKLYAAVESGTETDIVTAGTELLNDFMAGGYMNFHSDDKADVLRILAESYYRQEQYAVSAQYYQDALQEVPDSSEYLRDYMVAMARDGQPFNVTELEAHYPEAVLDVSEVTFIEAQSLYAAGDFEEALEKVEEAITASTDPDLMALIYDLQSDIYIRQERYGEAVDVLEKAVMYSDESNLKRKIGQTAFDAGNASANDIYRRSYYETALRIYEQICTLGDPSYEDLLNRALILRALGRYGTAYDRFREMERLYPDDYRIPMWMCYCSLDEAASEGRKEIPSEADFAYNTAKHLYEQSGETDPDMETLIVTMKEWE